MIRDRETLIREWSIARPTTAPVIFDHMAADCERIATIEERRGCSESARDAMAAAYRYRAAATRHAAGLVA